jgi:hypothetical protein
MRLALAAALLLALAAVAAPRAAEAQGTCTLRQQTGPFTSTGPEGQRVVEASGPLLVVCDAGEELRADSAVIFQAMNEVHLYGRVDYKDPTRTLTSDYATYNSGTGRLWATGNVVFTDRTRGSTLRGPNLEYFRAAEGRPEPQAIATGRPHLTVVPRSDGGRRRDPMEVDADRITTVGERFVTAQGRVIIRGREMNGAADEAFYDADAERMELRRNARATGDRYELTGQYIESNLRDGALSHVLARENARLVNDRLRVTGPQLQLWFEDDLLQRMVSGHMASGPAAGGRSVALASGFRMEADSLEAISPGQRMREVHAVGNARGESWDTTRVSGPALDSDDDGAERLQQLALEERDLIFADTIIGYFKQDTAASDPAVDLPPDTTVAAVDDDAPALATEPAGTVTANGDDDPELERMVATGDARSLYRTRSEREGQKAGINYVTGDQIDLSFLDGEVDVARVRGLKRGLYLDPLPGLVKVYRKRRVVNEVAVQVSQGEIVGLLGTQRGGEDDHLLHDGGADRPGRRGGSSVCWGSDDEDVTTCRCTAAPRGHRLPGAGALRLPQAHGRGERPRDPADAGISRREQRERLERAARRARHQAPAQDEGVRALRRRAAAARDHPRAGRRAEVHAPRRAVRRRRPDRGARHPADRLGSAAAAESAC